jgi:S1-C subfamily serine protease
MDAPALNAFSDSLADAVDRAARSVVQVQGRRRPASGVVFRSHVVVTTARALGREDVVHVLAPGGSPLATELGGWDPATGLIVLHVKDLEAEPAVPRAEPVRVGHLALAIGRSWSNAITATSGVVAIIGGPLPTGPRRSIDRIIRTTAPMHGGFAGGALVDVNGQLVGISTATAIRDLNVVIPVDIAWKTAATLVEYGALRRGYLGIAGQPVRLPDHQRSGPHTRALVVVEIAAGSPAEAGGMLVGDLVVAFDGEPVESPIDLLELLQGDRVGRSVPVRVIRGGEVLEVSVVIADRADYRNRRRDS